jgi:uncharacterized protein
LFYKGFDGKGFMPRVDAPAMPGRMTIGLYNSYDPVKMHEAHRRALARAGPLCMGFDCNLVAIGFPFGCEMRTPAEIVAWISETTSIGKDGEYLIRLAQAGRFQVVDFPNKGFQPQYGMPVLTTCRPDTKKILTPRQAAEELAHGQSILLVFGLGPRGVPKDIHEICPRHLDVTGRGLSMETATALGAVPAAINAHLQSIK